MNLPTDKEREALALLAEEMGEAIHVIGKCLRHGLDSSNPVKPEPDNHVLLEREIGDVMAAVEIATNLGMVRAERIDSFRRAKLRKINRWLHFIKILGHGPNPGQLDD